MLRIRLRRVGKKKKPAYRLVVADSRAPRDGAFVEIIGHYHPLTDPATLVVDEEKARAWLSKGAQPSDTVQRLLSQRGLVEPPAHKPAKPPRAAVAEAAAEAAPAEKAEEAAPVDEGAEAAPEEQPTEAKAEAEAEPEPEPEAEAEPSPEEAPESEAETSEEQTSEPAA